MDAVEHASVYTAEDPSREEPMAPPADPSPRANAKMLDQLAIAHYVVAVITAAKVFIGLPLLIPGIAGMREGSVASDKVPDWFMGVVEESARLLEAPGLENEPGFVALMLFMVGAVIVSVSVVHGSFLWWIGRCLKKRKRRLTVLIFSWMDLMYVPFGLVLGLVVIMLMRRPDVRAAFDQGPS